MISMGISRVLLSDTAGNTAADVTCTFNAIIRLCMVAVELPIRAETRISMNTSGFFASTTSHLQGTDLSLPRCEPRYTQIRCRRRRLPCLICGQYHAADIEYQIKGPSSLIRGPTTEPCRGLCLPPAHNLMHVNLPPPGRKHGGSPPSGAALSAFCLQTYDPGQRPDF